MEKALADSTTKAVTQDRDRAMYDWMTRHGEILERHRRIRPDLVFIGDSLIHYWGGEPVAPLVINQPAWDDCFQGFTISNLGFGWDRTENVLWRIENGELDQIQPRAVLIKIGTNNIGFNPPGEIALGIEAILHAVRERQPEAAIMLLGILPRLDTDAYLEINRIMAKKAASMGHVVYANISHPLLQANGNPDRAFYRDDVHILAHGYDVIAPFIRNALLQAL